MNKTPLHDHHVALGAKMVNFGGFEMPVYYSGISEEHQAVRNHAGLFDVSHMGQVIIKGKNSQKYLQKMVTSDLTSLTPGNAQYTVMCNENGGIIDDLLVYCFPDYYMLVVNAGNLEKNLEWLNRNNNVKAHIEDKSKQMSLLAIQGPNSREIVSDFTQISLENLKFYQFIQSNKFNSPITISRTGYTGELGYEMYCSNQDAGSLWDDLLKKGKKHRLVPTGLGARDLLRMEMKYCLYGNDIDETTHPFEAGLGWVVALDKDEFIGKEALIPMKKDISKRLICFQMKDRAIPRKGYTIWINDKEIGVVTSGGFSSVLDMGVGMGYVNKEFCKAGNKIGIDIRGNVKNAIIKKPPLYTHGTLYS